MSLHIGICTLNAMRTLPVVMDAIAQAKLHDKLWVVDSGSTDGTVEFAKKHGLTSFTELGMALLVNIDFFSIIVEAKAEIGP